MKQHQALVMAGFCALIAAYCFYFDADNLVAAGGWIIASLYLTLVWHLQRELESERMTIRYMQGLLSRIEKP